MRNHVVRIQGGTLLRLQGATVGDCELDGQAGIVGIQREWRHQDLRTGTVGPGGWSRA